MFETLPSPKYRDDIDGLRAIAVIAVIVFHYGHLPFGYLGVDIFFVISGFLITGIIHRESREGRFSIVNFYLRRIRRILPLVSVTCIVALGLGALCMLPDDLENLSQSVIATNFFGNNVLQAWTTKNYWDIANEYKPLMHTWTLAIEEQFYFVYPLIFVVLGRKRIGWLPYIVGALAAASLALFLIDFPAFQKFYFLQFRFYELAAGGILALLLQGRIVRHGFAAPLLVVLIGLLVLPAGLFPFDDLRLILTVVVATLVLGTANTSAALVGRALTHPVVAYIGKISFSLYMWHQVVLAFARYAVFQELTPTVLAGLTVLIFAVSALTYTFVENPFRNKKRVSTPIVLAAVAAAFVATTAVSLQIYRNAGVIRDVPELGIVRTDAQRGMHAKYNARVGQFDRPFSDSQRPIKVLVVGDSFARDWANVLLESSIAPDIEISYARVKADAKIIERSVHADVVFASTAGGRPIDLTGVEPAKVWWVGPKNFGNSSGYFYNRRGESYCQQRTEMEHGIAELDQHLQQSYPLRYINLIEAVIDEQGTVPVFTEDCKFISQDTRHFTSFGAAYFSQLLEEQIRTIIESCRSDQSQAPAGP